MKKLALALNIPRTIFVRCLIMLSDNEGLILEEASYWYRICHPNSRIPKSVIVQLNWVLLSERPYHNLLSYRLKKFQNNRLVGNSISSVLCRLIFPNEKTLVLAANEVGKNLFIQHGFSCCITADKIGENCWINQQVTIGYAVAPNPPVIGNGVRVSAGAKVIGDVKIGDNAIIGANAVVVKNVAENLIVGGVPAKELGINTNHKLYK